MLVIIEAQLEQQITNLHNSLTQIMVCKNYNNKHMFEYHDSTFFHWNTHTTRALADRHFCQHVTTCCAKTTCRHVPESVDGAEKVSKM